MFSIPINLIVTLASIITILVYVFKRTQFLNSNLKRSKNGAEIQKRLSSAKIVTRMSIIKTVLWLICFGGLRLTNLLKYLATLNKIVEVNIAKTRYLLVSDFKLSKEVLKNPLICGRQKLAIFDAYSQGATGMMNDGKEGQEHRNFCQTHLKSFGVGTKATESFIQHEADKLCHNWLSKKGIKFSPNSDFYIPVLNSLWLIFTGRQASPEISKWILQLYKDSITLLKPFNGLVASSNLNINTIIRLHDYVPIFGDFKKYEKTTIKLRSYFQEIIDFKKKTRRPSDYSSDLVDAYLNVISKPEENRRIFSSKVNEKQLLSVMFESLFAGGETTGSTLSWIILHLVRNPHIQEKIWKELDSVVGRDRNPYLNDRPMCPYTEAFIHEVLRFSPIASMGIPHATLEETFIDSQRVQKGTIVFINIYGIHHDPSIWGDPQNFRPERFLSDDGKNFVKNEAMCIFSSGPRKCIGDQVARDTLFLFTTTICNRLQLRPDPLLKGFPPIGDTNSALHAPQEFYMVATERFTN